MSSDKTVSHYDVALTALEKAIQVTSWQDDANTDKILESASKIVTWLVDNAKFEEPTKYVYYADEQPDDLGTYPDTTYWYRLNTETGEVTFMADDDGERRVSYYSPSNITEIADSAGLYPVSIDVVPEGAR